MLVLLWWVWLWRSVFVLVFVVRWLWWPVLVLAWVIWRYSDRLSTGDGYVNSSTIWVWGTRAIIRNGNEFEGFLSWIFFITGSRYFYKWIFCGQSRDFPSVQGVIISVSSYRLISLELFVVGLVIRPDIEFWIYGSERRLQVVQWLSMGPEVL